MAVTTKVLLPSKYMENTLQQQITAQGSVNLIDKFTVTNVSAANVSFNVHLVASAGTADASNTIIKTRTLAPNQTYNCPEIVGHALQDGASLYTQASAASALTLRISGREIS